MTDEAKALVERLRKARVWPDYSQSRVTIETAHEAADLIETQAREIDQAVRDEVKLIADWFWGMGMRQTASAIEDGDYKK